MNTMPLEILIGTEAERAGNYGLLMAYFEASIAVGDAERRENRARSDAKRAFWRAERHAAYLVLDDCNRAFAQYNAESAARCARWEAEHAQPVERELAAD